MKKAWGLCFGLSLAIHTVILVGIPPFFKQAAETDKNKNSTQKKEITIRPERIEKISLAPDREMAEPLQPKPLPYVEKILGKLLDTKGTPRLQKPQFFDESDKGIEEITVSEPSREKLKDNPAYMDYYRLIREKIRASTYKNYDTNYQGEVFASFLILQDGRLQNIQFNPGKQQNQTLYKIAKRSIESAAPFPAFPSELKEYRYLRFNISIYFKNN